MCVCVCTNLDFSGEGCHASTCAISRYVCTYVHTVHSACAYIMNYIMYSFLNTCMKTSKFLSGVYMYVCTFSTIQDDVIVKNCCCDSHHAYIQVVMIPLSTIACFGDVRLLNIILYILCVPTDHYHSIHSRVVRTLCNYQVV